MNVHNRTTVIPPPGWERHVSTSFEREYFVHVATNHRQWEFPSQSEVDDPIAAKKRRDDAETEKQRAVALRREAMLRQKKEDDELQLSYQIAIQKRNEEAMQLAISISASSDCQTQTVDDNYIKIYADGFRGLDDDYILRLFKISRKKLLGRVGGAALLVMERDSGERAIRHFHDRQTKGGRTRLTVKRAFNQDITSDVQTQLSKGDSTSNGKYSVNAFHPTAFSVIAFIPLILHLLCCPLRTKARRRKSKSFLSHSKQTNESDQAI